MKNVIAGVMLVGLLAQSVACSGQAKKDEKGAEPAAEKKTMTATSPSADPAGYRHPVRNESNAIVTLETSMGNLTLELYRDVAPAHADSFLARVKDGFYSKQVFHRIIDGFMLQGGDPRGDGTGDAGYRLNQEFSEMPHVEGTLSAARSNDPNSASCQFFVCFGPASFLDRQYTVFGHLIKGYDVLQKIAKVPVKPNKFGEKSEPVTPVNLVRSFVSDTEGKPL